MSRLLRTRARRGEGGFALMAVLAVIALTAVVLVALLGMLITTMRATSDQEVAARELRAADGAIEAAIAQMRSNPAGSTDPCALEGAAPVEQVTFDQDTPNLADDITVDVECQIDVIGEDSGATGDQVRLVGGDGYQGDVAWSTDCGGPGPGCFPWSAATGSVPGGLAGAGPTLVHSGPEALRFNSGVTVKRGAATLRNPTDGSPAVRVAGQYLQGQPGLLSGGDGCGLLDGSAGTEAGRIEDLDGAPTCDDAGARDVFTSPTEARAGLPIPDTVVTSVPGCSGSVVTFPPGRYDAARTAQVNDLLDGSCTGRTFHFPGPGYHFDANDPSAGADRNALVFDDAGSRFVFGALGGGDALCDRDVSGASVVISARTEIQHRAGQLAICPRLDGTGTPYPAIYQETSVPNQPTFVSAASGHFQNIGSLGDDPDADGYAFTTFACANLSLSPCNSANRSFVTTWAMPGSGPLSSAVLSLTGSEKYPVNLVLRRQAEISVANAGGTLICRQTFEGLPNSFRTAAYDLLEPGSDCVGKLTQQEQLDGARITVRPIFRFPFSLANQELRIRAVGLRTNVWSGVVGSAGSRNGEWNSPGNVIADDTQSATPAMTCAASVCERPGPQRTDEHQLTTAGIDVDVPGVVEAVAEAPITSLYAHAKVIPPSYLAPWIPENSFFLPTGFTRFDLRTADGASCSVTFPDHVNSPQTAAFDLLHPSGTCEGVVTTVGQLDGASLNMTTGMDCQVDLLAPTKCWEVRPPSIQHLELTVTSDAWSGPPPTSRATIDASAGSTFNVFGTAWMPVSDLDIHWRGEATDEPLFGGEVVLHGLGSDMTPDAEMGAVCCSVHQPDSRTVDLVAKVDGEDRLRVKVRFGDRDPDSGAYSPGHSVVILDYRTCRRGGCGPNEPPPPGG